MMRQRYTGELTEGAIVDGLLLSLDLERDRQKAAPTARVQYVCEQQIGRLLRLIRSEREALCI